MPSAHRLAWVLLVAGSAHAEQFLSLGAFGNTTTGSESSSPARVGPAVTWGLRHEEWGVAAGLRAGFPTAPSPFPLEVFVRGFLTTQLGPWTPLLAFELGVSGLTALERPPNGRPTDLLDANGRLAGPVYAAMHLEPLRFRYQRFFASAMAVAVGTPFPAPGTLLRLQLEYLSVGVTW